MSGEEESLEKCAQSIVENSVSCSNCVACQGGVCDCTVQSNIFAGRWNLYTCTLYPEISSIVSAGNVSLLN